MAAKYSFLLLALFAINSCNCQSSDETIGPVDPLTRSRSLVDQIRSALNDLKMLITTSIGDSFNAITTSYNKLNIDVMAIVNASNYIIKCHNSAALARLSQFEALLRSTGQSLDCTAYHADIIREFRDDDAREPHELSECANKQVIRSTATIGRDMETVNMFNEVCSDLYYEFTACGEGINAVNCLLALQLKINVKRQSVSAEIKAVADKAIEFMEVATQKVKMCGFKYEARVAFGRASTVDGAVSNCAVYFDN